MRLPWSMRARGRRKTETGIGGPRHVIILPTLGALGLLVWFANGIRKVGAVSSGNPIEERPRAALLLIDCQTVLWNAGTYSETAKADATAHFSAEVEAAKSSETPVVSARHQWSIPSTKAVARLLGRGLAIEGKRGTELLVALGELVDHIVTPRVQDAFETGELDCLLGRLGLGKLRIPGLDTNYCVAKPALAASQRGFEVVVVRRGTLAADQRGSGKTLELLRAKQVTVQ